jgi:tetratricopeptide (TPR) repeat protein
MNKLDLADTLILIKENLVDEKQSKKAVELLERILQKYPGSAETHRLLGQVYYQMKQYDNAFDRFIDALLIDPDNSNPKFRVQLYSIATFYRKEEYGKKLEQALELIPKCIVLYIAIGYFYKQKNRYMEAISIYTKGIKSIPNAAELYYSRAEMYAKIGGIDNAISDYEMGLKIDQDPSKNYWYYLDVSGLYLENQNFIQSLIHLNSLFQFAKPDISTNFGIFNLSRKKYVYKYFDICKNHLTHYPEDQAAELCYKLIAKIFESQNWELEEQEVIIKETCH